MLDPDEMESRIQFGNTSHRLIDMFLLGIILLDSNGLLFWMKGQIGKQGGRRKGEKEKCMAVEAPSIVSLEQPVCLASIIRATGSPVNLY